MKSDSEKPAPPQEGEAFLSRWSRKKGEARREPPEAVSKPAVDDSRAPELPPVEKLTLDSDYRPFFHPKVGEDVRRAALKKLFGDPRFNVMDGLDVYIDDYSKSEPIPPEMLAGLRQAQNILQWAREDAEERERKEREKEARASVIEAPALPAGAGAAEPESVPENLAAPPEPPKS